MTYERVLEVSILVSLAAIPVLLILAAYGFIEI